MRFIADLHVHSRFSRATSPKMSLEGLNRWAQIKGISVIGTGDFTHPEWFAELEEKLEPESDADTEKSVADSEKSTTGSTKFVAGSTLLRLKDKYIDGDVPESCRADVRFILQAEVSSIYKKNGRGRKVHSIILAPGLDEAREINRRLGEIGNLKSDGRPILGLDAKLLLELVLDVSADAMVIPAHIWTPHFSVLGAVSGFDSLRECYDELTPHIYAVETGLSSDPPMNRRIKELDNLALISNSDAHSPQKLGREANIFDTERTYGGIIKALKTRKGLWGTIEFFPEEGKYHMDGHRNCGVRLEPEETKQHHGICPNCGRKLTVGVMYRVDELAGRKKTVKENFHSIIPLAEMIAELMGRGVNTKGVQNKYHEIIAALGNEFQILVDLPLAEIEVAAGKDIAEAIGCMRLGDVFISPGYDGVFGIISVTGKREAIVKPIRKKGVRGQGGLF